MDKETTVSSDALKWDLRVSCDTFIGKAFETQPHLQGKELHVDYEGIINALNTLNPDSRGGKVVLIFNRLGSMAATGATRGIERQIGYGPFFNFSAITYRHPYYWRRETWCHVTVDELITDLQQSNRYVPVGEHLPHELQHVADFADKKINRRDKIFKAGMFATILAAGVAPLLIGADFNSADSLANNFKNINNINVLGSAVGAITAFAIFTAPIFRSGSLLRHYSPMEKRAYGIEQRHLDAFSDLVQIRDKKVTSIET